MTIHNNWTGECPAVVIQTVQVHHHGDPCCYELQEDQPQECGGGLAFVSHLIRNDMTGVTEHDDEWPKFYICTQCGNVVGRLKVNE